MTPSHIKVAGLGVVAGVMLQIGLSQPGMSVLFVFFVLIPLFVLFIAGLGEGTKAVLIASGCAAASMVAAGGGMNNVLSFVMFYAAPVYYFVQRALLWRVSGVDAAHKEWYPLGNALLILAGYFCIVYMLIALSAAGSAEWLQKTIDEEFSKELARMEPAQAETLKQAKIDGTAMLHLFLGMCVWLNVILSYGMAVAANQVLKKENTQKRPSMRLQQFHIPTWILLVLAGSAAVLIVGGSELAGSARVLLVGLLVPYFLSGLCYVHDLVAPSPWRAFLLAGMYLALLYLLPLVGLVIFVGLAYQCKLLKRPVMKK
jgi:hypothetical protein